MKKIILSFMTLLVFGTASTVSAQEFDVAAKHAIAVEATTGKILYEKDANQKLLLLRNWLQFIWSMKLWIKELSAYLHLLTFRTILTNLQLILRRVTSQWKLEIILLNNY